MTLTINILLFLAALVAMEGVAWFTHRYVMHGPMWFLHGSHHSPRDGWFEWNDLFAVIFSVPSIVLIWLGTNGYPPLLWIGLGMAAYGLAYFAFHDVVVHRRLPVRFKPKSRYMRRIVQAHVIHHQTHRRDGAMSFGFLYAPPLETLRRGIRDQG